MALICLFAHYTISLSSFEAIEHSVEYESKVKTTRSVMFNAIYETVLTHPLSCGDCENMCTLSYNQNQMGHETMVKAVFLYVHSEKYAYI